MKKILVIMTGLIILHSACDAQYKLNKTRYDYHVYSYQMGDPYNPPVMSLASVFIPGLGQIIEGESLRGFCFLGGSLSLAVIKRAVIWNRHYSYTFQDVIGQSNRIGQVVLRVWSAIDASRVAKVNDLAFRDKYNSPVSLKILPYPDLSDQYGILRTNPVGITLIVSF
jgi:hypothetical protein